MLLRYLPDYQPNKLPMVYQGEREESASSFSERDLLYKVLFDMKQDLTDLKKLVVQLLHGQGDGVDLRAEDTALVKRLYESGGGGMGREKAVSPVYESRLRRGSTRSTPPQSVRSVA